MIEVEVTPDCTLELCTLHVQREAGAYLVGSPGTGSYLLMQEPALEVVSLLQQGLPLSDIKQQLASKYDQPDVQIGDFVQTLLSARFVRRIGNRALLQDAPDSTGARTRLEQTRGTRWLFGHSSAAVSALLVCLACAIVAADPARYLSSPARLLAGWSYPVFTLVSLLLGWLLVAKHEVTHVLAAHWAGVPAQIRLGHRLLLPILQTDLTELWSVPRPKRIVVYAAGIASDLLAGALAVFALALASAGVLPLAGFVERALRLTLWFVLAGTLWQCSFFLRTDVYYALADVLGCFDLHADARAYLRACWRRITGRAVVARALPTRELRIVRVYALILVLGVTLYATLGFVAIAGLVAYVVGFPIAWSAALVPPDGDMTNRMTAAAVLALTLSLLGWSIVTRRRRARAFPQYRLIAPAGL